MTGRRLGLVAAATTALLLLVGCGGEDEAAERPDAGAGAGAEDAGPGEAGGSAVAIEGFKYSPADLTVAAGTEVVVTNADEAPHTLTADDGSFDTGDLAGGEEGSITIDEPGEHAYRCEIHQYMRGSITVE